MDDARLRMLEERYQRGARLRRLRRRLARLDWFAIAMLAAMFVISGTQHPGWIARGTVAAMLYWTGLLDNDQATHFMLNVHW